MKRTTIAAGIAVLALAGTDGSGGQLRHAPNIEAADGVMHLTASPSVTTCTGADGQAYVGLTATYTGAMVSTRPEFDGTSTVTIRGTMNAASGAGIGTGSFKLVDAAGAVTVQGTVTAVMQSSGLAQPEVMRGLIVGTTGAGNEYVANFEAQVSADFTSAEVSYGLGSANVIPDLAVTSSGACH